VPTPAEIIHPEVHRLAEKARTILADELDPLLKGSLPEIQAYAHQISLGSIQMFMVPPGPLREVLETELRGQIKLLAEAKRLTLVEGSWLTVMALTRAIAKALLTT
jgi:hypothetical protein